MAVIGAAGNDRRVIRAMCGSEIEYLATSVSSETTHVAPDIVSIQRRADP